MEKSNYDYDYFVIGGGSGGLASVKRAKLLKPELKVAVADFVKPTPIGTKWGLGGTCVNVGCIPKKLMHIAALTYESTEDLESMGHPSKIEKNHNWTNMVSKIQLHIKKLNFGSKTALNKAGIDYFNSLVKFVDAHTLSLTNSDGKETKLTADKILIATGGRPNYYTYQGAKECCITSDDIFSYEKSPGKTLIIGAGYIALECGGFLNSLGYDTTIMVRSILLRGFDQDFALRIGDYMSSKGCKFINKSVPVKFSKKNNGKIEVIYKTEGNEENIVDEFDTVLLAIGRKADTQLLDLSKIGVKLAENGKIIVDEAEKTNIDNIYAIGDVAEGRPELTPPAIHAGRLLSHRLFAGEKKLMCYDFIATTIFTPIEFGTVGFSEENAIKTFGKDSIKVYHSEFKPLEWEYDMMRMDKVYVKLVINSSDKNRVIGFHILSPHAGEITQGMSAAITAGVTKEHLDNTVGIHPTIAEEFTTMKTLKEEETSEKNC